MEGCGKWEVGSVCGGWVRVFRRDMGYPRDIVRRDNRREMGGYSLDVRSFLLTSL